MNILLKDARAQGGFLLLLGTQLREPGQLIRQGSKSQRWNAGCMWPWMSHAWSCMVTWSPLLACDPECKVAKTSYNPTALLSFSCNAAEQNSLHASSSLGIGLLTYEMGDFQHLSPGFRRKLSPQEGRCFIYTTAEYLAPLVSLCISYLLLHNKLSQNLLA